MQQFKFFTSFFLAAALLTGGVAQAGDVKVAAVEVPRLLTEPPQVHKLREKLKEEFASRDSQLVAQQKQIKQLEEKLSKDGAIMSEDEVKRLERDIISRRLKLKNARSELQQERQLRQNEELDKLRGVLAEVIQQVAREEKLDIVLESGVTWVAAQANITDKVLAKLRELDKAGK